MEFRIEKLTETNIKDLKTIYKVVFGNKVSDNFVFQKFDTSYLGLKYFGHLAYHHDKPIAFHGAIPVMMRYNDQTEIAAQYGDAMTFPEYTGKGLFTKLGKLTDIQLQQAGIKFVWGFPNQNSEYGYINKLDWKYVERMQGFKIKTSNIPIEKIARKVNFTNQVFEKHLAQVFAKHQTKQILKGSVYDQGNITSTSRNIEYYKYKSFADNFIVRIEECLFWIKIKNGLLIGDIEIPSEEQFQKGLKGLKDIAAKNGIGEIIFQSSPDTLITQLMEKQNIEQFESWAVGFKNFDSQFPLDRLKLTFGDLDTF
ncbi:GNAT family N-acetyltransferase [Aquimarina sp. RZ0]|uniref:GNAT family N-acetyltransferase n=1 Tax=Aquimarina sp. RZ0 TaxID=2607730 RepID=UPI0011F3E3C4|nr:GNAT family N-acetyltransferase [Aquimarina sp. RZ0]KAA1244138.1 GNAT family N-acetyltransferase [Aquimarina sp. RZ0]